MFGPEENCDSLNGKRGAGTIKSPVIDNNGSAISVYLTKYDPVEQPAATLFSARDCTYSFGRFYAPTEYGISNDYHEKCKNSKYERCDHHRYVEAPKWNVGSDAMRSLMVPYGVTIQLYESDEFNGHYNSPITIVGKPFINENQEM